MPDSLTIKNRILFGRILKAAKQVMKKSHQDNRIAVTGMACIYPGTKSPEELWRNVLAGRRYFRKTPPERLPMSDYFDSDPDAPEKTYSDQMALIADWKFDPIEFRIPPVVVEASDISHWLALSTSKSAIEDAGILVSTDLTRVGVILGNSLTGEYSRTQSLRFRWPYVGRALSRSLEHAGFSNAAAESIIKKMEHFYKSPLPAITEDTLAGNMSNTIAGRICSHFNFGGGGFIIDGACSSSLLALAHSCNALVNEDLDVVVAGGVDVSLDPFEVVGFAKARALAAAGDDIRPYDRLAAGMLPGEGCGIVVLMREEDALKKGYPVHAVIKGWGYSSDGQGSITAPEQKGQMRALRSAYERAGYSVSSVTLVEGHGTGTTLGDRVEVESLKALIDESQGEEICWLGSIKGNIGHTKSASGMAGFIKAVMALKRKIIPPTVNCNEPNEAFGMPLGRLRPTVRGTSWAKRNTPRRASVSAMGFGGSNAHITMEETNPEDAPSREDMALLGSNRKTEILLLTGDTLHELKKRIEDLLPVARKICRAELTDLAAHLAENENKKEFRVAVIAESPWELAERLEQLLEKFTGSPDIGALDEPEAGIYAGRALQRPRMVALFPGQGSQYLNMGEYLFSHYAFISQVYLEADGVLGDMLPRGLRSYIFMNTLTCKEGMPEFTQGRLKDTQIAQPAIVLSSIAAFKMLEFFGLKPDIVIGHSLGQITALHAAGVFDGLTAVRIAALRGRAMAYVTSGDPGAMLAVNESQDRVEEMIQPFGRSLAVSNYNSRRQTVVSGSTEDIRKLMSICAERHIRCRALDVSHAFHSEFVAPASKMFRHAVDSIPFEKISGRVISTLTGDEVGRDTDLKDHLADHIRKPVRFTDAVLKVAEERPDLWVEIGPKGVLTGLVRDMLGTQTDCFVTDSETEDGSLVWNRLLARAFVLGFPIRTERLFAHRFHLPFEPEKYDPEFIENPCERPVNSPDAAAGEQGNFISGMISAEISGPGFQEYLKEREKFIKEFIALDFKHYGAARSHLPETAEITQDHLNPAKHEKTKNSGKEDIVEFAREWVSRRTGFPVSEVLPEKRLRDDLGLDSIKTGELIIALGRKFGVEFKGDPSSYANAQFSAIIDSVRSAPYKDDIREAGPETMPGADELPDKGTLPDVIRTFPILRIPAPLDENRANPLPGESSVLLLAGPGSGLAKETAGLLKRKRHGILSGNLLSEQLELSTKPSVVIIILSPEKKAFFECTPGEFNSRIEGLASKLFRILRQVLEKRGNELRVSIVRETLEEDPGLDLDGGSGFLKTLSLEYPEVLFKWLKLPFVWPAPKKAEAITRELETSSPRVLYEYKEDGTRLTTAAVGGGEAKKEPFALGPGDVLFATGGAKGITFELARGIARKTGVKLALAGSSSAENEEVLRNLGTLKEEGIPHLYIKCDVTDAEAVRKAVQEITARFGPVTGALHGAGVSRLSPFSHMDPDDFLRSIKIKAAGLHNILLSLDPEKLRVLHVISSILGKTGMKGQADYTFANAWLDHALMLFQKRFPSVRCLSLGYSIWKETGLGKKLGAVETLSSLGITGIGTDEGVASYLELAGRRCENPVFAVTGRLTPELECKLFPPYDGPRGRYLDRIVRYIPGGEVLAETSISHKRDLYLREHVFQGTTVFPGVMAIEAVCEAAMACTGRDDLPLLRPVKFRRPLIVPDDLEVRIRIQAVAGPSEGKTTRVAVTVRSEADGFKDDHYSAECFFGLDSGESEAASFPSPLPERLWIDPETFVPEPLFQGKFFRRISSIRVLGREGESITDVSVPGGERYFADDEMPLFTPSPAARDAFLQSGALALPFGYLPLEIGEIRFHEKLSPGSNVICRVKGQEEENGRYKADISVFGNDGRLMETMRGILLARASGAKDKTAARGMKTSELKDSLKSLFPGVPLSVAFTVPPRADTQSGVKEKPGLGQTAVITKPSAHSLACVREAAIAFVKDYLRIELAPNDVGISYRPDGKPALAFERKPIAGAFSGADVSLSDIDGMVVGVIGPGPIGIDIEIIKERDPEVWRGLLGEDGYELAGSLALKGAQSFDSWATIVWTLLEAGKKANSLKRILPGFRTKLRGPWFLFEGGAGNASMVFLSAFIVEAGKKLAFSLAMNSACLAGSQTRKAEKTWPDKGLDHVLRGFIDKVEKAGVLWRNDGVNVAVSEGHHGEFEKAVVSTMERLKQFEAGTPAARIREKQLWMQKAVLRLAGESVVFRRASEKPMGYAGDFMLLDMIFRNELTARGIGYHFDRYFLSYPGSEAVRERSFWVIKRVEAIRDARKSRELSLLDLGCGPVSIERTLIQRSPENFYYRTTGIDYDENALEFASRHFEPPNAGFIARRENLISAEGLNAIEKEAAAADLCMCMGLVEYLEDDTVLAVLESLFRGCRVGTHIFTANYIPGHYSRTAMEWLLDWRLVYRTEDKMRGLAKKAGFKEGKISSRLDPTGSIVLMELER